MKERLGALVLLLVFVAAIWLVYLVNVLLLDRSLNQYGLSPVALPYRFLSEFELSASYAAVSLRGILFSPLLHGSFSHLLSNTLPLLVLGCVRRAAGHEDAHRRVTVRGCARRSACVARRPSGRTHRREWAGVRLFRLPAGTGLVRAECLVDSRRVCGAAAIRRNHLRRASAGWLYLVGGAPVRLIAGVLAARWSRGDAEE